MDSVDLLKMQFPTIGESVQLAFVKGLPASPGDDVPAWVHSYVPYFNDEYVMEHVKLMRLNKIFSPKKDVAPRKSPVINESGAMRAPKRSKGNPAEQIQQATLQQAPPQPANVQPAFFQEAPLQQLPLQRTPLQKAPRQRLPLQESNMSHQNMGHVSSLGSTVSQNHSYLQAGEFQGFAPLSSEEVICFDESTLPTNLGPGAPDFYQDAHTDANNAHYAFSLSEVPNESYGNEGSTLDPDFDDPAYGVWFADMLANAA